MQTKLNWVAFLDRLPGSPNDSHIAESTGIARSNISRWRTGQQPRPAQATAVARAYGLHPLGALVESGHLSQDDLDELADGKKIAELLSLDSFSDAELAIELARRLTAQANG